MVTRVIIRRDPAAQWTSDNPVLGSGELGCESDTGKVKVGDGSSTWTGLDYAATTAPVYSFQGSTSGYASGGNDPSGGINPIDKFPFSSDGNATDVGDLTAAKLGVAGQSSTASGYVSGGYEPTDPTGLINVIEKFPFSSDGNATDVGDLTGQKYHLTGQTGSSSGYTSGGSSPTGAVNVIEKFPFSTDANATDVGDLTVARAYVAGQSSDVSGYTSGGYIPPTTNVIDKFSFSSDANATDVGDLSVTRYGVTGQSSTVSGYSSGGGTGTQVNVIDKFPFSSDGNATDVGDLTVARYYAAGQQV